MVDRREQVFTSLLEYLIWQTHTEKPLVLTSIFNRGFTYRDTTVQPNVFVYIVHLNSVNPLHTPEHQMNSIIENISQHFTNPQQIKVSKKERRK